VFETESAPRMPHDLVFPEHGCYLFYAATIVVSMLSTDNCGSLTLTPHSPPLNMLIFNTEKRTKCGHN
jgi:hypothetical protein